MGGHHSSPELTFPRSFTALGRVRCRGLHHGMGQLELTARRQAAWSAAANRLKARLDGVRWAVFCLSVLGALLATIASQLSGSPVRSPIAIASAIALAVATFLTARLVSAAQVSGWVRARAAAEALKREAFRFAASAAPYDDAVTAEARLGKERSAIEANVDDLIGDLVEVETPAGAPAAKLAPEEYVAKRVRNAIDGFYRPRAGRFSRMASRLRATEFVLALTAAILAAVAGVWDPGSLFDLAALTAVLTTVGALVLAHIENSRYEYLSTTYRATARRLEEALTELGATPAAPSKEWSDFVERCEAIIAAENNSWVAKWSGKPNAQQ